jgi:hypothetical protein
MIFMRTARSMVDVANVFRMAVFHDFVGTLLSAGLNVVFTLVAALLMQRMHNGAYEVFYNFATGVLNPKTLVVMAAFAILLMGAEFVFLGLTFYPKGYIPALFLKFVFAIRNSIVVMSGVALGLALFMFASDPIGKWDAYVIAVIYLIGGYLMAFLCVAPFYLESSRFMDRLSLVAAGVGLILLVWYWPDLFSPEHFAFSELLR